MLNRLRYKFAMVVVAGLAGSGAVSAQEKFEVASVRAVGAAELQAAKDSGFAGIVPCSGGFQLTRGRVRITAITVVRLIAAAYGQSCSAAMDLKLIAGGPEWMQREVFHIQATLPEGAPNYAVQQLVDGEAPVLQAMLRNLLAERFGLVVSRASKEVASYNVSVAKGGVSKMKLSADQKPTELNLTSGARGNFDMSLDRTNGIVLMRATAIPMSRLINTMQGRDGRMVFDRTEMTGVYDIPGIRIDVGPSGPGVNVWPEIMRALGFKVEAARGAVEFLTVERLERPSEN